MPAVDEEPRHHGPTTAQLVSLVVAVVLIVVILVLSVANRHDVNLDYVVGNGDVSLLLVILVSAIAGAAIAAMLRARRHHQR